ncbi:unnamed protein product [Hydatigera taeniaeformis]|uniref:Mannosyltransferase n=1 Tax=Hydatigena taeniaeformis TaxID=6205 RepID=A0A0R3WND5_HYDTA|nr:unnamed protein product [Hydatigera taeniaeformis]
MQIKSSVSCYLSLCASSLIILIHILSCPYNKVEESFNIQAIHDIVYHGSNLSQYDHLHFPGPVPRTFIGPLLLALPCLFLRSLVSKTAFHKLGSVFRKRFHPLFYFRFLLITYTQFHLAFYSTRTLPNTFALVTIFLLRGSDCEFIMLSGFGILVFRSELLLLYGPLLIFGLYHMLTVVFDSYFWQRWLWPEGEVFYFNVIENKSHLWGLAVRENHPLMGLEIVALVFITLYSFLPHKELRFIIYTIPIFNLLAAYFWSYVCPAFVYHICRIAVFFCYASLFVNLCASIGLLFVSSHNYPGGEAITRLNKWPQLHVHVYIGNLAAQTGVSRFQEINDHWTGHCDLFAPPLRRST